MASIDIEQNKPECLGWLKAQRRYYAQAKSVQTAYLVIALALPIFGLYAASFFSEDRLITVKATVAYVSILLLLAEVGILSGLQRDLTKKAAKIQELFDTKVLFIPWSKFVVGTKIDAEDIKIISMDEFSEEDKKQFTDWYEPTVGTLPIELGRLICQRTNITYDMRVRRLYARGLLALVIVLVVILSLIGLYEGSKFSDLLLTLFLPFLPLASFALKDYRKHIDAIEGLTNLKGEVEKLWANALENPASKELTNQSRDLQDAIYRNRTSNPLIYDWVYKMLRSKNETLAYTGAKYYVAQAQEALKAGGAQ